MFCNSCPEILDVGVKMLIARPDEADTGSMSALHGLASEFVNHYKTNVGGSDNPSSPYQNNIRSAAQARSSVQVHKTANHYPPTCRSRAYGSASLPERVVHRQRN